MIGEDPAYVERLRSAVLGSSGVVTRPGILAAALSALDLALWDLHAKALGVPLYQLLGAHRDRVPCYGSAGLYGKDKTPDDLAAEMAGYAALGFAGVKMKVGGAPLAEDVARVAKTRAAVGPGIRVMVDALNNLNVPQALRMARAFAPYDVHFFEAPVATRNLDGQAEVNRRGGIPVCGNEAEHGLEYFREMIARRAVEYVQFDLAACGGIGEGRRIAALAEAYHRPCTLHASSSAVVFAASLHFAAATASCESVEYHMVHQWLFDLAPAGCFAVEDGFVRPPAGPGMGLEMTPDDVAAEA